MPGDRTGSTRLRRGGASAGALGVAAIAVASGFVSLASCGPSPERRVDAFVRAHNARQPTSALSLLTGEVAVDMPGARLEGTAAVGEWLRWDSVVGARLSLEGVQSRGDTVTADRLREANEWLALLGLGEIVHEPGARFVLHGDRVASIAIGPLEANSRDRLDQRMSDFLPWTLHESPDRLRRIRPEGEFDYSARRAADWLSLVRAWSARGPPR